MRRGQLRDGGTGFGGGWSALRHHFRGCYTSLIQTHSFIAELFLSAGDRLCLCVSVRACGKAMLSY